MVGGFSECQMLQEEMKTHFERNGLEVLAPSEAQLAIIKGAVLFGHLPQEINQRVAAYSYGFSMGVEFDSDIHDQNRIMITDFGLYCKNVFECMVEQGTAIKHMETRTTATGPPSADSQKAYFPLFRKDGPPRKPVQYTDVPEMTHVGTVIVDQPGYGMHRTTEISFQFGGTEIKVEAKNLESGNKASTTIDFLT